MFDSQNERLITETIFVEPGRSFYLRELAEEAGVSASTVSRLIDGLEEKGLVEVERDLKMEIKASRTERFRGLKRGFNLWRLEESGLADEIEEALVPEAIVLFGSYAKGEDDSDSDIDIAVVNGREASIEYSGYSEVLGRDISLHSIDLENVDENFIETLANGIVLRGYLGI